MTCKDCEKTQLDFTTSYYFRWKDANIELRCCQKHAGEIIEELNLLQKQKEGKMAGGLG